MAFLIRMTRPIFFFVLLCTQVTLFGQTGITIRGRVQDGQTDAPISGATLTVTGTSLATSTNESGSFSLQNVPRGATLTISYIGYETSTLVIQDDYIEVLLQPNTSSLEDVVVIGYGSVKRRDVTTAISSVSLDDLNERPIVSAGQAIQGRAAGVSVIQPNGAPGGETSIRIRGTTSFNANNDPLYVVDGVPVDNLNFLSPNDIADMQILKDASSAAIYGSRAANGVVLITTKQGKAGDAKIAFNMQATQNKVISKLESLNAAQYKELQDEIGVVHLPEGLPDRTNWFDETFTDGLMQNYQLSIADGTDRLRYFLSGGYLNESGIIESSFYRRYNFRGNIENNVRDWLKINANIAYSDDNRNGINTGNGANRGGVVLAVINTPTYAEVWDPYNPSHYNTNFYGVNITSPLENIARTKNNKGRENRIIASGSATVTFSPALNFRTMLSLDRRNGLTTTFLDPISTSWGRTQYGQASDSRNMNTVLTFDNVLNYNKQYGKHGVDVMAGTSWTASDYRNSWINGSHFRNDLIETLNVANRISWTETGSGASQWAIMSLFGRISYNFDGKYLLTANLRGDGSSKLHPDYRWGTFPSVSAGWRLSAENFLADVAWLNDLKIRGGWGQTGNQSGLNDYAYLQMYRINRVAWFVTGQENALPTINQANLRTRDLRWETTTQANVGVDFTGFSNRLTINLDYYHKRTKDMLMFAQVPTGAAEVGSIMRNEGIMTNRGLELNVSSKNLVNDVRWSTDFNISFNRNKLVDLELQKIYSAARTSDFISEDVVRNEPGRPLGGFFGYISDGVDPETGELMYRDINGDGRISSSDRTYIGDPNPDFIFGLTNNISYKGFHLSVFLQGSYGNDVFNASRIETEGMYDGKNQSVRVLERWRVPGQQTVVPKAGFDLKNSSYFVEDGSYLRVKNISLSYDVNSARLGNLGIRKLQPFISVSNVLTVTKYTGFDPEVNQWGNNGAVQGIDWGTYPQNRAFVAGLNLEF
ncbi:TonB-linked SusC/RagA family outer membrane protein [Sphingobacterium allocomposti]|uniref:TonB-linked SusC/RagA family outer membrane protein n=1 Tax=Sphingobacterium allocomposti TaxID=415956 RepID=A0A5S5DS86_9SPHI|nr:TonB-dependent receptor [Sphingobacterium composti Yoo et al. 2007 non Ten et al. 2007]TYP98554.1 TonB-linked SusC/RagA family outer membrane protein [Sphingobacterium composti Yoo et al. 2007 non Ten et al. 2007]